MKVLREDLDDTAPLFVSSTNPTVADIPGAAAIPADGVFSLRGVKDSKNVSVKIQVHLGTVGGPVSVNWNLISFNCDKWPSVLTWSR